jgi:hypothetical protein
MTTALLRYCPELTTIPQRTVNALAPWTVS